MRILYAFFVLLCVPLAQAQLSVVSSSPANNTTNVPLTTTISLTFSAALDTAYQLGVDYGVLSNITSYSARRYSADLRTVSFDVTLSSATVYVVAVYSARGMAGAKLLVPFSLMFTTGSSFPAYNVSGIVLSGSTGVSPANALVILSRTPITEGSPDAVSGTFADASGAFTLPHVPNGTYYLLAAKDVDGDGQINPQGGSDVVAFRDPITINNGNLVGLNVSFVMLAPLTYAQGLPLADSLSATLPADKTLRAIAGYNPDSLGRSDGWEYFYLRNSFTEGYRVQVGSLERRVRPLDAGEINWLTSLRPLADPGSAANSTVFVANVENSGGRQFRTHNPGGNLGFSSQINVGDLRNSWWGGVVPNPSLNYWGAAYSWGYDSSNTWVSVHQKLFIGDYSTGSIILVTDVKIGNQEQIPSSFVLSQNYPNPFNPTTTIKFQIPNSNVVSLKVYDVLGREVRTLVDGKLEPGSYEAKFDATGLASGVYMYRVESGSFVAVKKLLVLR